MDFFGHFAYNDGAKNQPLNHSPMKNSHNSILRSLFFTALPVIALSMTHVVFAGLPKDGLYLHLTADDVALSHGAKVTSWSDMSGGNILTNVDGAGTAPLLKKRAMNGHAVVSFDGVNDNLEVLKLSNKGLPSTRDMTFFIVAQHEVSSLTERTYLMSSQTIGPNRLRICSGVNGKVWLARVGAGSSVRVGVVNSRINLFTLVSRRKSRVVDVYLNDPEVPEGSGKNNHSKEQGGMLERFNLGGNANGDEPTKEWAKVDIAEVLIYNHALTSKEIIQVNDYLTSKYLGREALLARAPLPSREPAVSLAAKGADASELAFKPTPSLTPNPTPASKPAPKYSAILGLGGLKVILRPRLKP